jgi:hypothetical protein
MTVDHVKNLLRMHIELVDRRRQIAEDWALNGNEQLKEIAKEIAEIQQAIDAVDRALAAERKAQAPEHVPVLTGHRVLSERAITPTP